MGFPPRSSISLVCQLGMGLDCCSFAFSAGDIIIEDPTPVAPSIASARPAKMAKPIRTGRASPSWPPRGDSTAFPPFLEVAGGGDLPSSSSESVSEGYKAFKASSNFRVTSESFPPSTWLKFSLSVSRSPLTRCVLDEVFSTGHSFDLQLSKSAFLNFWRIEILFLFFLLVSRSRSFSSMALIFSIWTSAFAAESAAEVSLPSGAKRSLTEIRAISRRALEKAFAAGFTAMKSTGTAHLAVGAQHASRSVKQLFAFWGIIFAGVLKQGEYLEARFQSGLRSSRGLFSLVCLLAASRCRRTIRTSACFLAG
mmetsp:Transcript_27362/g.69008  ORF Transcript_27362/g.69008 Transcript_27362/m.69008 type:complete len:310 (+) Transcript_27362:2018-2947(+)